jgi:dTDP-4-dehydrorhamnose reductase
MRAFVIGSQGQVARSLKEAAIGHTDLTLHCTDRSECDLTRPASIASAIETFRPDIVINPAAYTAVDKAEAEPDRAFALNRDGARAVAAAAEQQGVPVIHISTDYVFDGRKSEPYVESDPVNPQSVYGCSKLAGELAVAEANPRHVILRTSWVYAPFGGNFVRTMLRLSAERDELRVVDDQIGCPTYAPDIAAAMLAIARKVVDGDWQTRFAGVTHLAGSDALSWCDFARAIVVGASARGMRSIPVQPIRTADYPTAAVRPANSRLATARLRELFDVALPPMQHSLAACLDHLLKN